MLQAHTSRHNGAVTDRSKATLATPAYGISRKFVGAEPVAGESICKTDTYQASSMELEWSSNALKWTAESPCSHMNDDDANAWIRQNENGDHDLKYFSVVCREGKLPQFIEPLAGILRDPRFTCQGRSANEDLFSVDWLVFPGSQILAAGAKARFYDAGGSQFHQALEFFLKTYQGHGIVFDEVYVWEYQEQGKETYWADVDDTTRAFWEPRVTFYDGIPVTAETESEHNPVSRIFGSCAPEDFCAFKLDIDTPETELPLINQLLDASEATQAKLDEIFFEHHVHGAMEPWWGKAVNGTFEDSYKLFRSLRDLGVRAHSWV